MLEEMTKSNTTEDGANSKDIEAEKTSKIKFKSSYRDL